MFNKKFKIFGYNVSIFRTVLSTKIEIYKEKWSGYTIYAEVDGSSKDGFDKLVFITTMRDANEAIRLLQDEYASCLDEEDLKEAPLNTWFSYDIQRHGIRKVKLTVTQN